MFKNVILLIIIAILTASVVSCTSSVQANSPIKADEIVETDEIEEQDQTTSLTDEEKAQIEVEEKIAERELLEQNNKIEQGQFYVPLVPLEEEREKKNIEAKALYATGYTASNELREEYIDKYARYVKSLVDGDSKKASELYEDAMEANKFERIVGIADATEINAVVINVKDDNGFITYNSDVEIVKEMNLETPIPINDVEGMLEILKEHEIYTIGRIVTFKDKNFALLNPDHAIQMKTGGTWLDPNSGNIPWVNPFDSFVWDYNVAIAKEAALLGFDEIQFDYVRFPDGAKYYNDVTEFPGRNGMDKDQAIAEFLKYSKEQLEPYSVNIGADVFGIITRTWDDYPEDIGQTWILMGQYTDNIAPMIYPSHYSTGWYVESPNDNPYLVAKGSMEEAIEKNSSMETPPIVRPWIQDFDWAGKTYGPKELREQIVALKELGIDGYMVWNPSNAYDPNSFIETDLEKESTYPVDKGELDYREKSPSDAANKYLVGKLNKRYSYMYLMTPIEDREEDFDNFVSSQEQSNIELLNFKVYSYEMDEEDEDKAIVSLYYKYEKNNEGTTEIVEKDNVEWEAVREKNIWKIKNDFN
jgi:hypothetical protein